MKNDSGVKKPSKASASDPKGPRILKAPPISNADEKRIKALREWEERSEKAFLGYRVRA